MTETQATETKTAPVAEAVPEKVHPPGYEPVDFDKIGLTAEQKAVVEARTRYLYHQVKAGKEERESLRKHNDSVQKAVDEQNERLASLEKDKVEDTKAKLTQVAKAARDEGRFEDELAATTKLTALEAPKPKVEKTEDKDWWRSGVEQWAGEVDGENNIARPWIREDHPDNVRATGTLFKIKDRWEKEHRPLNKDTLPFLLAELDMHMKSNGATKTAAVLSTSQVRAPAAKDTELTQDEKYAADKIMTHVKDPVERYRRYAAQRKATKR